MKGDASEKKGPDVSGMTGREAETKTALVNQQRKGRRCRKEKKEQVKGQIDTGLTFKYSFALWTTS
jgi:hypothetical protein